MGRKTFKGLLFVALGAAGAAHAGTILVSNTFGGTIGAYTTSGAIVNASLITGLTNPDSLTLSVSNLFVSLGGNTIANSRPPARP